MIIPPPFDPEYYVGRYPDLSGLSAGQAAAHYETYGRAEGRVASAFALRDALARCAGEASSALEIGPFSTPALRGPAVRYLDVLDADEIRARAGAHGLDVTTAPAHIDYVGGIEQITERFDAVFSGHCIEHQPDLVLHLSQVAGLLNPGGRYFLVIPDKRYCFDHFVGESTAAEVVDAHVARHRVHTLQSVIESIAFKTHNDSVRHWRGDHGPGPGVQVAGAIQQAMDHYERHAGGYVDAHAWQFTPDSFATIIGTLNQLGLCPFRVLGVYDTPLNMLEFCAVLEA